MLILSTILTILLITSYGIEAVIYKTLNHHKGDEELAKKSERNLRWAIFWIPTDVLLTCTYFSLTPMTISLIVVTSLFLVLYTLYELNIKIIKF